MSKKEFNFHCYDYEGDDTKLEIVVRIFEEDDEIGYDDSFVLDKKQFPKLKSRDLGTCILNDDLTEVKDILVDQKRTKLYLKNMKKIYNEMVREKPYIKFYVIGEGENVSGRYKIFMVEGDYNEFYCSKENIIDGMDELFNEKHEEIDKVPHIQLFYELSFKDKNYKFDNLDLGMEGEYSKTNGVIKYKNLKKNIDKCNEILNNVDKYLSSYHYSYSVESIGLKLEKIE